MKVSIRFDPRFRELTGCATTAASLAEGVTLGALHGFLIRRFPKLAAHRDTTAITVGEARQEAAYRLREGDEVTLAPGHQAVGE